MSSPEDELQRLEDEKTAIESRAHDGYKDAARLADLKFEIEDAEEQLVREKQRAVHGEG